MKPTPTSLALLLHRFIVPSDQNPGFPMPLPAPAIILGGHSYIAQLGNEPRPNEAEIDTLVSACLDQGITRFDTTYRPERLALGASLARLRRRPEARLIVWNFFESFTGDATELDSPAPYSERHLGEMCSDLQTDYIDELVVHQVGSPALDASQEDLALRWQAEGFIGRLGTWCPGPDFARWSHRAAYAFAVEPCNIFTPAAPARIAGHIAAGAEVYGCSPFVRGWQLDRLVAAAVTCGFDAAAARARLADHLLRHAAFAAPLAGLIVSMRRAAWVAANRDSLARGPLSSAELTWLSAFIANAPL